MGGGGAVANQCLSGRSSQGRNPSCSGWGRLPKGIGGHKVMGVKRNDVTSKALLVTHYFFSKNL